MLLLTSTSDILRVVTSAATATLAVHADWVDNNAGTITPGRTNTGITGAATTTLVAAPAGSTQRNVQTLLIRNTHATLSQDVEIQHYDGTTSVGFFEVTLAAGEMVQYLDGLGFQVLNTAGAVKTSLNQGQNTVATGTFSAVVLGSDVTNNNAVANTIADVTGLSFAVNSGNKYWFRFVIPYTSAATTTGSRWAVNGPAFTVLAYTSHYTLTATSETVNSATAYDIPAAASATSLTTANVAIIEGVVIPSANGSVIARFASEIASSAIVAKAGAYLQYQQIA